jgi:hypothetical protein
MKQKKAVTVAISFFSVFTLLFGGTVFSQASNVGWLNYGSDLNNSFSNSYQSNWSGSTSTSFVTSWSQKLSQTSVALSGDLLGKGQLEVVISSATQLNVYDNTGKLVWTAHPPQDAQISGGSIGIINLAKLGGSMIVLATVYSGTQNSNGASAIVAYSGSGQLLKTISGPSAWAFDQVRLADLDGDGNLEVITTVYSGYTLSPRGVYVYNYNNGSLKWSYLMGPTPHLDALVDLANSGKLNVVVSTFAPCNGYSSGGTSDNSIYVIALNPDGTLMWCHQLGSGAQQHVRLGTVDFNHDSYLEVLAFVRSDPVVNTAGPNDIYVLNGSSGSTLNKYTGQAGDAWHGFSFGKVNQKNVIYTDSESGKVAMFDENLKKITETNVGGVPVPFPSGSKNGAANDGPPTIVTGYLYFGQYANVVVLVNLPSGTQQIRVFDCNLVSLWTFNIPVTSTSNYYNMVFISNLENDVNDIIVAGSPGVFVLKPPADSSLVPDNVQYLIIGFVDTIIVVAVVLIAVGGFDFHKKHTSPKS